ncbi:hypothetical protein DFH28DRAFT_903069 [Melampsora americana]|nr:hypothetical protein DFH28DRAFT_903069 [Melampsora americana]
MLISAMDPSMLVGFLVRNEEEWEDLTHRIRSYKPPLFHIAEVTPSWMKPSTQEGSGSNQSQRPSDDSDLGIDSWSEQDDDWGEGGNHQEKTTDESSSVESIESGHQHVEFDDTEAFHLQQEQKRMMMGFEDEEWDEVEDGHSGIKDQEEEEEEEGNEIGNVEVEVNVNGIGIPSGSGNRSDTLRANKLQESITQALSSSSSPSCNSNSNQLNALNKTLDPNTRRSVKSRLSSEDLFSIDHQLDKEKRRLEQTHPRHQTSKSLSIPFKVFPLNSTSNQFEPLPLLHHDHHDQYEDQIRVNDPESQARSRNVSATTVRGGDQNGNLSNGNGNRNEEDGNERLEPDEGFER